MRELAHHIIGVANKNRIGVIQRHLQLVLYFTLIHSYNEGVLSKADLESIYDDCFRITPYGPGIKSIREEYKSFNSSNITLEAEPLERFSKLDEIITNLLNQRTSSLIQKSYKHPLWSECYQAWKMDDFYQITYNLDDLIASAEYETNKHATT